MRVLARLQLRVKGRGGVDDDVGARDLLAVLLDDEVVPDRRIVRELEPDLTGLRRQRGRPVLQGAGRDGLDIRRLSYLREYARALSVAAARAPAERDFTMFNEHAAGAIAVECSLHESFFADFGLSEEDVARTPVAPTNLAYTSYLIATAYGGSFPELLGAVLPCYWIYWEVGKVLLKRGSPDPLYGRWIETYGGEEFAEVARAVLALTDRLDPSSARRSARAPPVTSPPRAATSGCSGTWAIRASPGRSRQSRPAPPSSRG